MKPGFGHIFGVIARNNKLTALEVGGIENHIYALVMAQPIAAPSRIAQCLKGESSKWIHTEFSNLQKFAWQDGYGVFSVSRSKVMDVIEYIRNQRAHHRQESFEDEYVRLMKLHEVEYDERYLFD